MRDEHVQPSVAPAPRRIQRANRRRTAGEIIEHRAQRARRQLACHQPGRTCAMPRCASSATRNCSPSLARNGPSGRCTSGGPFAFLEVHACTSPPVNTRQAGRPAPPAGAARRDGPDRPGSPSSPGGSRPGPASSSRNRADRRAGSRCTSRPAPAAHARPRTRQPSYDPDQQRALGRWPLAARSGLSCFTTQRLLVIPNQPPGRTIGSAWSKIVATERFCRWANFV